MQRCCLWLARTRKIDLASKTVLPGFNDAHAHPVESGVQHLRKVACDTDSIDKIEAALHQRALQTPPGGRMSARILVR